MKARLLLLAVPLLLAGCGAAPTTSGVASAGDGTAKPTASASASADRRQAMLKFAQCMRENGVDMADPDPNGSINYQTKKDEQAKTDKAAKVCQPLLDAALGDKSTAGDSKRRDEMVKYVQCMREQGIDMEDPDPNGGVKFQFPAGAEAKVKAAEEACKEFSPGMEASGQ
ncbi:hypothetical protein [Streptosporangium sp. NPDC001681]|uniref:hypothetical protein n=1 Tax=Streptosporangium sp. NPDC001681 TaxID=3154395 RepID=UPI003317AD8E